MMYRGGAFGGRKMWLTVVIGIVLPVLLMLVAKPGYGATETMRAEKAKQADAFIDSIGINVHTGDNRSTSGYANFSLVKEKLAALGVRHARDGAVLSTDEDNRWRYGMYRELERDLGVKFDLIVDPRYNTSLQSLDKQKIAKIAELAGPSLEAFEALNEYDHSGDSDWVNRVRSYQRSLYESVKGNPSTANVPVIGPSVADARTSEKVGDLSGYMDYGNMHSYAGGRHPLYSSNPYDSRPDLDTWYVHYAKMISGAKPLMATEAGYHNALGANNPSHKATTERAAGRYTPRMFLEYFNRGIPRTYAYELMDSSDPNREDPERNFGLLHEDGTEKPSFTALKNLIDLLKDPGSSFTPGSLEHSLSGDTENVHHTLLQKRDGKFYLVLWQEVSAYDISSGQDISVPSKRVNLNLGTAVSGATTYLPKYSASQVASYDAPSQLTLDVPDHPLVVELKPSDSGVGPTPPPPSDTTKPTVVPVSPVPSGTVRDRTPTIRAIVRDPETELEKTDVALYIDGRLKTTSYYDQASDSLSGTTWRLSRGWHWVTIVARDAAGNTTTTSWSFRVTYRSRH